METEDADQSCSAPSVSSCEMIWSERGCSLEPRCGGSRGFRRIARVVFAALLCSAAAGASFTVTEAKGNKPVADAVVSLVPLGGQTAAPTAATPVSIVQKDKEFTPQVTAVLVGSTIEFANEETKGKHHVYSLSAAKKFEIPLHDPGNRRPVVFDKSGIVALGCNIHDWMRAYVVVLETPWFAKTAEAGAVEITAPAGRYRVEVWHPRLKKIESREVTLPVSAPTAFALALEPDQRIRRGPTAVGGGYK